MQVILENERLHDAVASRQKKAQLEADNSVYCKAGAGGSESGALNDAELVSVLRCPDTVLGTCIRHLLRGC